MDCRHVEGRLSELVVVAPVGRRREHNENCVGRNTGHDGCVEEKYHVAVGPASQLSAHLDHMQHKKCHYRH